MREIHGKLVLLRVRGEFDIPRVLVIGVQLFFHSFKTNKNKLCNSSPVDGIWSQWSSWSNCSKSCGTGSRMRSRSCTNPSPSHGGSNCSGSRNETEACNTQNCPGGWINFLVLLSNFPDITIGNSPKSGFNNCEYISFSYCCCSDITQTFFLLIYISSWKMVPVVEMDRLFKELW